MFSSVVAAALLAASSTLAGSSPSAVPTSSPIAPELAFGGADPHYITTGGVAFTCLTLGELEYMNTDNFNVMVNHTLPQGESNSSCTIIDQVEIRWKSFPSVSPTVFGQSDFPLVDATINAAMSTEIVVDAADQSISISGFDTLIRTTFTTVETATGSSKMLSLAAVIGTTVNSGIVTGDCADQFTGPYPFVQACADAGLTGDFLDFCSYDIQSCTGSVNQTQIIDGNNDFEDLVETTSFAPTSSPSQAPTTVVK